MKGILDENAQHHVADGSHNRFTWDGIGIGVVADASGLTALARGCRQ
jgi:hypothetical protein